MPQRGTPQSVANSPEHQPSIQCTDCAAAVQSPGRDSIAFLLVDHLTIPLVGCADHLEQFGAVCGLTTEDDHSLLQHLPAGGVTCPGCRHAHHTPQHPLIPVDGGALALLACPRHQSAILSRYETGRQTQHRLSSSL